MAGVLSRMNQQPMSHCSDLTLVSFVQVMERFKGTHLRFTPSTPTYQVGIDPSIPRHTDVMQ
jgi:hypothetical protein